MGSFPFQFENAGNRSSVKSELKRAQQTIAQLQNNLGSMRRIRPQINDVDVKKFDTKMREVQSWINDEIKSFGELDADFVEYLGEEFHQLLKTGMNIDYILHFVMTIHNSNAIINIY